MAGMTRKENFMAAMNHDKHDYVPVYGVDCAGFAFGVGIGPWFEKGPDGCGYDGFGVRWMNPASGSGNPIPAPGEFLLDSETIVDWKKIVKFPDVTDFDWEGVSKADLDGLDRNEMAVDWGSGNGPFERLAALTGFEEALVSMAIEPEASKDLMEAIVDYKLQVVDKVAKYYKPEYITNFDDYATERSLFMSPATFRELIKPCTTRYYDAIRSYGIQPIQHTCGYAEAIVPDMIDMGAVGWCPVQPSNDIAGILDKYGDRFTIQGGWDSNGVASRTDATDQQIYDEIVRCFDEYGHYDGYIFQGFRLVNSMNQADYVRECNRVSLTAAEYAKNFEI